MLLATLHRAGILVEVRRWTTDYIASGLLAFETGDQISVPNKIPPGF
jgi:hypothetical protein